MALPLKGEKITENIRLFKKYGIVLKRSLGQNFLSSEEYANRIVEASDIKKDDTILEIGAGAGTLTLSLAMTGAKVYAIEIDNRMEPILKERLAEYKQCSFDLRRFF